MGLSFNFIHIRGIVSLARHMRRKAKHIHTEIERIDKEKKEINKDFKKGDADKLESDYKDFFKDSKKLEKLLDTITKDFLIIEREVEKEEHHEEDDLRNLLKKLKKEDQAKLSETIRISRKIHTELDIFFHKNKVRIKDLYLDREKMLKYTTFKSTDIDMAGFVKKMARLAKRDIKHELVTEKKLDKAISELIKVSKGHDIDQKDIDKHIETINKYMKEFEEDFLRENNHLGKEMGFLTILHLHLIDDIEKTEPQKIKKLLETEYPDGKYKEIEHGENEVKHFMHHALKHIYDMSRFVEHQS